MKEFKIVVAMVMTLAVGAGLLTGFLPAPRLASDTGAASDTSSKSCTIFTVSYGDRVFYGGNEDYTNTNLIVGFFPPTSLEYGSVRIGYRAGESQNYQVAMNDQGLVWDINSIPEASLNPHPERPFSGYGVFLTRITNEAVTVEEVVQLAHKFDFGNTLLEKVQIHVADSTGDAVIIGPGPDGEIAFTRKDSGDGYLVSTNFNRAIPTSANHPETYLRYDNAAAMLEKIESEEGLTLDYLSSILETSHFEFLSTYTLFSYVFDTKNKTTYLYYMSDFDELIELNLPEELARGQRVVPMADLVSQKTLGQALSKHRATVARDVILLVIFVGAVAIGIGTLIVLLVPYLRRRKSAHRDLRREG